MDVENGDNTHIWLEREPNPKARSQQKLYTSHFKFNKHQIAAIKTLLKQEKLTWDILISSAWGLFLNHFSTSDNIRYAKYQDGKLYEIIGELSEDDSLLTYLKKIKSQKKAVKQTSIDYLLVIGKANKDQHYSLTIKVNKTFSEELTIYYNNHFNKEAVKNIFEHLLIILLAFSDNIKQPAATIDLLANREREKILSEWRQPHFPFQCPELDAPITDLFAQAAIEAPSSLAISHNDISVSYKELDKASKWLAKQLLAKGVQRGDNICVLMDRTSVLITAMLAIMRIGAVYVPINTKYPSERIDYILRDSEAKLVLLDNSELVAKDTLKKSMLLPTDWQAFKYQDDDKPLPSVSLDDTAYIIYTSGTTGNPKGVMIKHKSLTNLVSWYYGCFNLNANDRASQFASQAFDTFLCETIPYLASGASIHIIDDHIKLTAPLFFDWLVKHHITIADLPTAYLQILFTMQWPDEPALRIVKVGGERLTNYPPNNFPADVWNIYGPTEDTIESTFMKIHSKDTGHAAEEKAHPLPLIGKPLAHCYAYVVNKYNRPVPEGIAGELLLGGDSLSTGYLHRPDLNNEKFIENDIEPSLPGKLYKTGDLVRWDPEGNLEYIGRIDHQVKIRGYRIELGEIEKSLTDFSDINEVAVVAKENVNHEKSLIAYVVPNLNKVRYLFQERCLVSVGNNKYSEAISDDISCNGIALSGISEKIEPGAQIKINIKLPGLMDTRWLTGRVIWQQNSRCGIYFGDGTAESELLKKSVDYLLMTHNVMEMILTASAKRSLNKALKRQLPEYMIPHTFVTLLQFPMTFSGKVDLKALPPPQDFEQLLHKEYILPKTPTEEIITEIWRGLLDKKNISMADNFFDLGGNSLKAAELSIGLLNRFNISIPVSILFDLSYIPVLAKYIDSKGTYTDAFTATQQEIERDKILPDNIMPTGHLSPHLTKPKNILLTGAGGFLGIYLLRELLKTTDAKIYCLVRRGEFETAAKKIISTIQKFGLQNEMSLDDRRIVAVPSDISLPYFGLPLEQYNAFLNKIDLIYHCGAQVNIMAAYSKLRGSNVTGTLEIIKFATTRVDKPIHYISTLSAAYLKNPAGELVEDFPSEHYSELFGGYAITKWVSERLLTELKDRGLPIAIYRSGYISGQSDTGMASLNDALFMLIKGCIQLGYAPMMYERVTILPVDYVSEAVVGISLHQPTKTTVYHIDHPVGIMWPDLVNWLNAYGYKIKMISIKEWQAMLVTIPRDNALFPFLPYYLSLPEGYHSADVSTERATEALQAINLPYPAIDDKLLKIYFNSMQEVGFLPRVNTTA